MWRIEQVPKRTHRLLDGDGKELGRLVQPSAWSGRAEVLVASGLYEVWRKGMFTSKLTVTLHGVDVAFIRFGWGGITIERAGRPEANVRVERPSIWRSMHRVVAADGRELARLDVRHSWKRMGPVFTITAMGDQLEPLVLLLTVWAILVRNRRAAAAAAAG